MKTNTRNIFVGVILMIVMLLGISMLTACNDVTLDKLQNEYGIVIDGGGFEEGSTLVSNEIATDAEEGAEVLAAIADQNYNKDGSVYIFDIYVTKDGAKVQPSGKVKVSVPLPNIQVDNYLVFHVKADNSVENLVPTVVDGKISFETSSFSYFIIAEAAPDEHVHDYVWVEGTEPTCEKEGVVAHYHCDGCGKNFDENYGEIDSVVAEKGSHDVAGNYSPRVEPTFFTEGTVAYYTCNDCLKYIDEDGQIIPAEDITIPAWTQDVTIYVNDVATKLVPIWFDKGVYPTRKMNATSLIYDYLNREGMDSLIAQYDLFPFEVNVQAAERTFVDKLCAIGDYYLSGTISEHSRHIYDLHKLLEIVQIDDSLRQLLHKVAAEQKTHKTCLSAQEGVNLKELLAEIVQKEIYRRDYEEITASLLFDNTDYQTAIRSLSRIIDSGLLDGM